MKITKWITISILIAFIISELYFIVQDALSVKRSHLLAMIFLIILLLLRNKFSWLFLLILCVFGIYNMIILAPHSSAGVPMDFTHTVNYHLFNGYTNSNIYQIISVFPLVLYSVLLVFIILKTGRRYYKLVD